MDLNGIPLFSLLQSKLGYLGERQKVIAQNVANASTPAFTPSDLKPFSKQQGLAGPQASAVSVAMPAQTDAGITLGAPASTHKLSTSKTYVTEVAPDSETTLNGNQVVLEEQMIKMSESRSDYDAAIGFYQKSLDLLHLALKKPGG